MRQIAVLFLVVVTACTGAQELAVTSTTAPRPTTTAPEPTTTGAPPTTIPGATTTTVPPPTTTTLAPLQGLVYEPGPSFSFPIMLTARPGEATYVATKAGDVFRLDGDDPVEVLNIRGRVRNDGEQGLLGLALHPDDATRFFIHYSGGGGATIVSEFTMSGDGSIDPDSERELLRLSQPAGNHNGGMIQFGPDGRLYLGLGDGGGANDRFGNGQNRDTLLGGLVVMNVDGDSNPELFQYGLRNPWRFWIDGDEIYIADVGQNAFEEVSVAPLVADINHGWPITEGLHCFRPSSGCDTTGLTLPVIEVAHGDGGTCSITGGVVYRGDAIPELDGTFFFSDFCGGYLRGLSDGEVTDFTDQVGNVGSVGSFGQDGDGEVWVLTTGQIFKIVPVR